MCNHEPIDNIYRGAIKPRYTGITKDGLRMHHKDQWRNNMIPYFGLLSMRYKRGMADAYDVIIARYVRMKVVVWPDEYQAFRDLFLMKHPEFRGKTSIDRNYNYHQGAFWNDKYGGGISINYLRGTPGFSNVGQYRRNQKTGMWLF